MAVKPISPKEIREDRINYIPEKMIEAANALLQEKWEGSSATIKQEELMSRYLSLSGIENSQSQRQIVYEKHFLDIEPIFRDAGWSVKFDSPSLGDNYKSYFKFTQKK